MHKVFTMQFFNILCLEWENPDDERVFSTKVTCTCHNLVTLIIITHFNLKTSINTCLLSKSSLYHNCICKNPTFQHQIISYNHVVNKSYRMRVSIGHDWYIFNLIFEGQFHLFNGLFFFKFCPYVQLGLLFKSGL